MIKLTDYIAKKLKSFGVEHVFMIAGGGAMHLNDSFGRHLNYTCNHHEQASAIAAEGYARAHGKISVVCVTTGPGGINTLNGVFGQWTDSIPVLYISGQVKFETTLSACPDLHLRQLGDQEADIITLVKPITKYAKLLTDPNDVGLVLHTAIHTANAGRPGPVWIDIPMNVQGAMINETLVDNRIQTDFNSGSNNEEIALANSQIDDAICLLQNSKRPLIVAGHGITISKTKTALHALIEKLQIPVVTTFNGFDTIHSEHPLYIGRIGTIGQRAGNFSLQNSDCILFLGTRNNIRQISYNWSVCAKNAKKIIVDIDLAELQKPTIKPDIAIHLDLNIFFKKLLEKLNQHSILNNHSDWLRWCQLRKIRYEPSTYPPYQQLTEAINPYYFTLKLSQAAHAEDILIAGNGSACVCLFQAGLVKQGQRIFWNSGNASMGYDLPAAIGASVGKKRNVICIAGDGSLMMNLQELQTVKHYQLPIKIFVLNNNGYSSIRQTQRNFFEGGFVACCENSGVSVPDFTKIANAFGIPAIKLTQSIAMNSVLQEVLSTTGPILCEVMLEKDYIFQPKLSSEKLACGKMISKPLEDMYPFLDREEFSDNMIEF